MTSVQLLCMNQPIRNQFTEQLAIAILTISSGVTTEFLPR